MSEQPEVAVETHDELSSEIVIDYDDILPTQEELMKFAIVFKNKDQLVKVLGKEDTEARIKEYDELCLAHDIDGDSLLSALFISRLFYLSNVEVEIVE
jgi:hypothetical protein